MGFDEILAQIIHLLQRDGRISYTTLKLRFALDDISLQACKNELIEAKCCAVDEQGKVLVWIGDAGASLPASSVSPWPEAERRQLTVLFCDVVDSTVLSEQLDPEDLREVMLAYQATCAEVIQRFEGYIAQYLGDGVLVYYGYPRALEDAPQRAVRTALGIVEAVQPLNRHLRQKHGVELAVRLGIHTGLVVVGGVRDASLAWGDTLNLAARLQGIAAPNAVVISAGTYALIQGYFVCQEAGRHHLKGFAAPVQVYLVLQEGEAQSRFDVAVTAGLTPLIDREAELLLLQRLWEQSSRGQGQVVLLSGEGGIGKSRLIETLCASIAGQAYTRLVFRCSPYHTHSAFYAVTDHLRRRLQWQEHEAPAAQRARLERMLQEWRLPVPDTLPLFATLLSLPMDSTAPVGLHDLLQMRQKLQETLVAWLLQETTRQPVLVVWEDLHWADPSTLELLNLLINRTGSARLLTLLTFRPELHVAFERPVHLHQIQLGRLERSQVEQMVRHCAHAKALPREVFQDILDKTDGVPLFVEELVKMVLESGLLREEAEAYVLTRPLSPLAIPATLQDSLMARLDRLRMAKDVAQFGATLGREFSYALIRAVAPLDETVLQDGLAQLVEAALLYQEGAPPHNRYCFKHALIQEAAYKSLLRSTRRQIHQRVAEVLTRQFPEMVMTQPELLAHHYTEAGLGAEAIPYWQQAGQRAIERSANTEAVRHLTRGLEVLVSLPVTPARDAQELALQLALGSALYITRGRTVAEVEQAYTRAYTLCLQVGSRTQQFAVAAGLWRLYASQAQLLAAQEWAEQCFDLAQGLQEPVLLQEADLVLGTTLFFRGALQPAHEHLQQGIALYTPQRTQALTYSLGTNSGVECLARTAWTLWLLGYPEQALVRSQEALVLARRVAHAYSLGLALCHAAVLHVWRLETQPALEQSEALVALATEQGFVRWLAGAWCTRGWALATLGRSAEGIAQIRQGLETRGRSIGQTHNLAMLVDAYGSTGATASGIEVLEEVFADQAGAEHHFAAELYRLHGELLLRCGRPGAEAEARLHTALDIARQQHARSLELRAAMSLSRLWQVQGRRAAAHRLLEGIYAWFTEGFATPDLQAARALLDTLQ